MSIYFILEGRGWGRLRKGAVWLLAHAQLQFISSLSALFDVGRKGNEILLFYAWAVQTAFSGQFGLTCWECFLPGEKEQESSRQWVAQGWSHNVALSPSPFPSSFSKKSSPLKHECVSESQVKYSRTLKNQSCLSTCWYSRTVANTVGTCPFRKRCQQALKCHCTKGNEDRWQSFKNSAPRLTFDWKSFAWNNLFSWVFWFLFLQFCLVTFPV